MAQATTAKEAVDLMRSRFKADKAQGVDGTVQFDLSGDGGGKWAFKIANGQCEMIEGGTDAPTTTLSMSVADFVAMTNGTLSGMTAFMTGKIKLAGDVGLAMKIQGIFTP